MPNLSHVFVRRWARCALLSASERLICSLAEQLDHERAGADTTTRTPLAKSVAINNAVKAVDTALRLAGNPGLARSRALERSHRDVLSRRIHTPQDDTVLLAAGKAARGY